MKEINKLKFKRAMLLGSLMLGLTGCSIDKNSNRKDTHIIVTIGDKTIIFRNCDENYDITTFYYQNSYVCEIIIDDKNGNNINDLEFTNSLVYDGNDQVMLEIEEDLLKNGAYLYQLK